MVAREHYDNATAGTWTYVQDATHQSFIFKKGTLSDPVACPLSASETPLRRDSDQRHWLVFTSEWGNCNPKMIDSLCNLLNREGFR